MPALHTFIVPQLRPRLVRILGAINRTIILPHWCKISAVRLDTTAEQSLREDVASGVPMIFVPNHPEYFADWMLDKWLLDRVAPKMANWADAGVVNGMGGILQKLWLGNNLIAAVRGAESAKAVEYSIDWACQGNGVLLHPEGSVSWDNETIGSLFPGAARMAIEAARRHSSGTAMLAPLAWYVRFNKNVETELLAELKDLAQRLNVSAVKGNPAEQLRFIIQILIERVMRELSLPARNPKLEQYDTRARLLEALTLCSVELSRNYELDIVNAAALSPVQYALKTAKALRTATATPRGHVQGFNKHAASQLELLAKLDSLVLSATSMTQEQVTHRVRRIRQDWVKDKAFDVVNRLAPRGLASREAFIAVSPRILVRATDSEQEITARVHDALCQSLAEARIQANQAKGVAHTYSLCQPN